MQKAIHTVDAVFEGAILESIERGIFELRHAANLTSRTDNLAAAPAGLLAASDAAEAAHPDWQRAYETAFGSGPK